MYLPLARPSPHLLSPPCCSPASITAPQADATYLIVNTEGSIEKIGDFGDATIYELQPTVRPSPRPKLTLWSPTLLAEDMPWAPLVTVAIGSCGKAPPFTSRNSVSGDFAIVDPLAFTSLMTSTCCG